MALVDDRGLVRPLNPRTLEYGLVLVTLIGLTVADTNLVAVLVWYFNRDNVGYDSSTRLDYALYINQGTALVYGLVSIPLVLIREHQLKDKRKRNPSGKKGPPWYTLVLIGCMNGIGNFFTVIGQPHTRGETQALLSMVGIPFVIVLSWIFLGQRPSLMAVIGAALILGGTCVSSIPHSGGDSGIHSLWYSNVIFFSGQILFSSERVYEDASFGNYDVGVIYMFTWTLWTQFFLGWALYPLQTLKDFGDLSLHELPQIVWDGCKCTVGISTEGRPFCDWHNPFYFFLYCAVDYCCYAMGLYVIQRGGANLMVLASAIALPLSQLVFCIRPMMGQFYEKFYPTDGAALAMVLVGFGVYQLLSREGRLGRQHAVAPLSLFSSSSQDDDDTDQGDDDTDGTTVGTASRYDFHNVNTRAERAPLLVSS
eukprot:m.48275 g.48275  ORF g.48275 m.48275 type:complete len:424 (-) comp11986_c0_seq2:10-1281(-)